MEDEKLIKLVRMVSKRDGYGCLFIMYFITMAVFTAQIPFLNEFWGIMYCFPIIAFGILMLASWCMESKTSKEIIKEFGKLEYKIELEAVK